MYENTEQKKPESLKLTSKRDLLKLDTFTRDFHVLYNFFSQSTRGTLATIFYKAMKVVYFKYRRKRGIWEEKRIRSKKALRVIYLLSKTDISNAIYLVDHYLSNLFIIPPEYDPLSKFGNFPHGHAMDYYDEYVEGTIKDIYGRAIIIEEDGIDFLFGHDKQLSPENYEEARGKRLPWIRPTLENSKGIYEFTERNWTTYFYTSALNVPFKDKITGLPTKEMHYFFIVVRKEAGRPLRFITAYHFDKELPFLRYLEPSHPFIYIPERTIVEEKKLA